MNLNTTEWDRVLTESLTLPGVADAAPLGIDAPVFVWDRWNTSEWSARQAFERLGVQLLPFPEQLGQRLAGYACEDGIALNPRVRRKVRTAAHELAHVLLKHTSTRDTAARIPIEEFEAECVAMLVSFALDLGAADLADSRHYIQQYRALPCAGQLPDTWADIKHVATRILAAGYGQHTVAPEPPPVRVLGDHLTFAARINWHS